MAYRYTLLNAKDSGALKAISGVSPSSTQFIDYLNEAQRRLMKRGNFDGMEQTMNLLFQGCVVAWPREVGTVLGVRKGHGSFQIQNQWYSFTGNWSGHHSNYHGDVTFEDLDAAPVHNTIYNLPAGMLIRYYVVNNEDVGKKITLFGHRAGYQPLQESNSLGTKIDGLTLTAARPFVSTSVYVTDISSITREATTGMAYLYQYDPATNTLLDLAVFQPGDTNPSFRRSIVRNHSMRFCTPGEDVTVPKWNSIEALVKLQFIPVAKDRDFLLVDDFDALKFMIQAIKCEEANDHATAEALIAKAIRELNFGDRDRLPDNYTPVMVQSMSASRPICNPI